MKKFLLGLFFLVGLTSYSQYTDIPDVNFEQRLFDLGIDNVNVDHRVLTSAISGLTSLDVSNSNITDLTGIQAFTNLVALYCINNQLLSLDVSGLTALSHLSCGSNELTNINISGTILQGFYCSNNQLTSLNLSDFTTLIALDCGNNLLTSLNVSGLTSLTSLNCDFNGLTSLNVGGLTALKAVNCAYNQLSSLNLSGLTALLFLDCNDNQLTSLNLSGSMALGRLRCDSNQLTNLNVSGLMNLQTLYSYNNPNLTCITVSDVATASAKSNWLKDSIVGYSTDCSLPFPPSIPPQIILNGSTIGTLSSIGNALQWYSVPSGGTPLPSSTVLSTGTYYVSQTVNGIESPLTAVQVTVDVFISIPDSNFEQALFDLGIDTVNGDHKVLKSAISSVTYLNVSYRNIQDLTGIEHFTNLNSLDCHHNDITGQLDVRTLRNLGYLNCSFNYINGLYIQGLTSLISVLCNRNLLPSIDASGLTNLLQLNCETNILVSLNLNGLVNLKQFNCRNNQLESLNVSGIPCCLSYFYCDNNPYLSCITVADVAAANTNSNWVKDASAGYSTDCSLPFPPVASPQLVLNGSTISDLTATGTSLQWYSVASGGTPLPSNTVLSTGTYYVSQTVNGIESPLTPVQITIDVLHTAIPDTNFEQALFDLGIDTVNGDHKVLNTAISGVTYLDVSNRNIQDLTGIEHFINLTTLDCSNNIITGQLDVSASTSLQFLNCNFNSINGLNISGLTSLVDLYCSSNHLATLNVSGLTSLQYLDCGYNFLTDLNLNGLNNLIRLNCNNNQLTSLNLNSLTTLQELDCYSNQLPSLELNGLTSLIRLICSYNQLQSLNISGLTALWSLISSNNPNLTCITVADVATANTNSNWLKDATVGYSTDCSLPFPPVASPQIVFNGSTISNLTATGTSLQWYSVASGGTALSSSTVLSTGTYYVSQTVNGIESPLTAVQVTVDVLHTAIPDTNFEQALFDQGIDTINGDHKVLTSAISGITTLSVNNKNISDLTGIQAFSSLIVLECINNQISSLNLNGLSNLKFLVASFNNLTNLDVSSLSSLTQLYLDTNQLVSLNVSGLTNLELLSCENNQLTSLNLDGLSALTYVDCHSNLISSLSTSGLTALQNFRFDFNEMTSFDASGLTSLVTLRCYYNHLTNLNVSGLTALTNLYCSENALTSLNVAGLTALTIFNCHVNPSLACIIVSDPVAAYSNTGWYKDATASYSTDCIVQQYTSIPDVNFEQALINLGIDSGTIDHKVLTSSINTLTYLDVNARGIADLTGIQDFVALTSLDCYENQLLDLDVSSLVALNYLDCTNNVLLANLNITGTALIELRCSYMQLTSLNLSSFTALTNLNCTNNPTLSCIIVSDPIAALANNNWFKDTSASYSTNCILGTPTFAQVAPICSGETLADLPTTTSDGITGTWSPALDNTRTTFYVFTPDLNQYATSGVMTITVNPIITPTFTQVYPICIGDFIGALPTTSNNGITGTWSPAIKNSSTTTYFFTPDAGQCAAVFAMTIEVNSYVNPTFTQVAPICSGTTLSPLPTTSNNGITGTWSPALDNTITTTYTFTPDVGQCATSAAMTIVVKVAGTISGGNVTVCAPFTALNLAGVSTTFTNSTTITLSDNSAGSTVIWQRSSNYVNATNAAPVWSTVYNTSTSTNNVTVTPTSVTVSNLLSTIWYRAKVTNGSCVTYADPVKITVSPVARPGAVSGATSVCFGGNISFTSAAYTGSSIAWEVSTTSATSGFSTVAGENGLAFTINNVAFAPLSRFYVRSVVTSGSCTIARSGVRAVTVNPAVAIAGTVTGAGTFCAGSNSTLRISNYTGTIQWMFSTDGINFSNVPYNTTTLGYQNPTGATTFITTSLNGRAGSYVVNNITGNTYFKAVVSSGVCSTAESNVVQYTIGTSATAGLASAQDVSVCSGQGTTISLTGQAGAIRWQKSTNYNATIPTWSFISAATAATLATGGLTVPTGFRAVVSIGACSPTVYSNVVVVSIISCKSTREIVAPLEITKPFEIVAFPNPFNESFNIKLTSSSEENVTVFVYDMTGKMIESRAINPSSISELQLGNNYSSGIYNVIVNQGLETKTLRLIKK